MRGNVYAEYHKDAARATVKAAEARLAEVNLSLGYTRVNAPIAGLSSRANKSEGSLVNANETLLTMIWQVDPIWVNFSISENQMLAARSEQKAGRLKLPPKEQYIVELVLADGSVFPAKGRVTFANADYDRAFEASRLMPDGPERVALFKTMNQIILDQVPTVLGSNAMSFGLTQKWLRNFKRNVQTSELMYLDVDMALKKKGMPCPTKMS